MILNRNQLHHSFVFFLIGARFVFGETKPGDEYIMTAFGQKVILSKSEVEDFMDERGGKSF